MNPYILIFLKKNVCFYGEGILRYKTVKSWGTKQGKTIFCVINLFENVEDISLGGEYFPVSCLF